MRCNSLYRVSCLRGYLASLVMNVTLRKVVTGWYDHDTSCNDAAISDDQSFVAKDTSNVTRERWTIRRVHGDYYFFYELFIPFNSNFRMLVE